MLDGDAYSEQARDMLLSIDPKHLDKSDRVQTELNLALCHHSLESVPDAISSAEKVISLDKRSHAAVQAQWIILQNKPNDDQTDARLNQLLKTAESRNISAVANSIKLERARNEPDSVAQRGMYESIMAQANSKGETYDSVRAIVALGSANSYGNASQDKNRLIQAYHYLYKGGFLYLFNLCHDALWRIFEQERDMTNLLQLFKYSSLVWRLRGIENREHEAIKKLKSYVSGQAIEVTASSQTMAYYIFRSTPGS
ncbi:hypothetical protein D3C76_657490 [compost metagenome]